MVKVNYKGRLGNNMFQYALGRHIAEKKGYQLYADPLPFSGTGTEVNGYCFVEPVEKLCGHHCDLEKIISDDRNRCITLDGYFQKFCHYQSFLTKAREWFLMPWEPPASFPEISNDDLLIYIRLGDYVKYNVALATDVYEAVINIANPRTVYIVTENPADEALIKFRKYDPFIFGGVNIIDDLYMARLFRNVAISCSTFSWWAAVLSEAKKIFVPIGERGPWSGCNRLNMSKDGQDLRIDDARFAYLYNAPTVQSERNVVSLTAIAEAQPNLSQYHERSSAFWFE